MKEVFIFFIALFASTQTSWGQGAQWILPHVGYSSTDMLSVDKVEFTKSKTMMHVTISGREGTTFWIAPTSCLKADGKRYALKKVPEIGVNKMFAIPDSGKVHFTMRFEPLPTDTKRIHFVEGEDDEGWHLCNIRSGMKNVNTEIPDEWRNIEYEDLRELPESKLCDDSTTIRVLILNYVPEAGKTLTVSFAPIDFDKDDYYKTFDVLPNGTASFKLHPCFPLTIWMRLGKGEYFPLLIEPGKECDILMDLEKEGTDPCVAFKGALAKTNYELNVLGGKDLITHDKSDAYFDSIIVAGLNPMDVFLRQRSKDDDKIENSGYSGATIEWLWMRAESEYQRQKQNFNMYFAKKVLKDMESAGSILMNNKYTRSMVGNTKSADLLSHVATSSKLTLCPHYEEVWTGIHSKDDRNFSSFIQDLYSLHWAVNYNEQESYEAGQKWADKITDPTMKAFYPIAAKRWNDYVESIKRIPHIHYDEHGDWYDRNQKEKLLEDYRGKNVVFLVYNREDGKALSELEEIDPLIASTNGQKVVFIHIDTNFLGVRGWLQSARHWHGEHYGGRRTRYDSMFNNHGYSASGILYELHAPDGTTTLTTTDKKEALESIKSMLKR